MTIQGSVRFVAVALAMSVLLTMASEAATASFDAEVRRTLAVSDDRWGGCMVLLDSSPSDEGLDCPETAWVTFSCDGTYASKSNALRMYDSAQLAFVTGRTVKVWVDDSKKHNGYCFVSRIDVSAPAD